MLFTNCAKTGPQGETGAAGAAGKDGNANVKSAINGNLLWTYNSLNERYEALIQNTNITQDIIDKGSVLVAAELSGGNWAQLPFSSMGNANVIVFFDYEYFVGGVRVSVQNSDYNNSISPVNTLRYKVTVLQGTARPAKDNSTVIESGFDLVTPIATN